MFCIEIIDIGESPKNFYKINGMQKYLVIWIPRVIMYILLSFSPCLSLHPHLLNFHLIPYFISRYKIFHTCLVSPYGCFKFITITINYLFFCFFLMSPVASLLFSWGKIKNPGFNQLFFLQKL